MSTPLLPWNWVQQHDIVLLPEQPPRLCCKSSIRFAALAEARRRCPDGRIETVSDEQFQQLASACYQQNNASQQMVSEIGQSLDLDELVDALPDENELLDSDDGAPVIRLINAILSEAVREGASDVHIEPFEKLLSVRFRIDGMLRQVLTPPVQLSRYLISRLKVMAKLDIAEKRLPQDGRITLRIAGRSVDVRVSTLPASHGERVVLRILDKNSLDLSLENTGMHAPLCQRLKQQLQLPHGIILVTGPTGSGKSTTLYAALRELYRPEKNILTIEDPVEYELEGIGQTQVNAKVDMTFARGLRAILRQDPDVVMIGEIRDSETAQIAVQASLTGHLVLSTLHTNSALGAIERLRDMGIEPFLLANALSAVLAQRLVRKLCEACKQPWQPDNHVLTRYGLSGLTLSAPLFQPQGCAACNHSGYRGRTGIHELVVVDDALRSAISQGLNEQVLQQQITQRISLMQDGLDKALGGITSLEEVLRVSREGY
ncbi:type II secretion system ATPase GspE [Pantoea sp. CTOTU49201]|uniref:type II secretion system ATPase GspE n=1 Tax=Pantoea sp. CTOTU49201 TaxID=2953855 RepID=UPI00289A9DF9|nr:type II secretion system ATPase GspE [Pantoea sp. CTOTU49201]